MSRSSCPNTVCGHCRGRTSSAPTCSGSTAWISRCDTPRRSPTRANSAATRTGAARSGSRSISSSSNRCRNFITITATISKSSARRGSGHFLTLEEIANELAHRLSRIFLKDAEGNRAVLRHTPKLQSDPHYRDYIPFYEYFDGDSGRGVGASHQTGWTALIAKLLMPRAHD